MQRWTESGGEGTGVTVSDDAEFRGDRRLVALQALQHFTNVLLEEGLKDLAQQVTFHSPISGQKDEEQGQYLHHDSQYRGFEFHSKKRFCFFFFSRKKEKFLFLSIL